jgi:2-polyprenyl-3-methyl-5-hydroxy-6-metoxy-1,4-benzoquinol methylase
MGKDDQDRARRYFDELAPEYDRAFARAGGDPLNALVNRFFRGPTFARRMRMLETLFGEIGLAGRSVLDLGCGSGQVSLLAAKMGASVHAVDIAPRMLAIAKESAEHAGLAAEIRFEEGDVSARTYPAADVTLLVGVVEYYADHAALLRRAADAVRHTLIVAHTSRAPHRVLLRRLLFLFKGSSLYFHPMRDVIRSGEAAGLRLAREIRDRAFSILVFERR